MNSTNYYSSSKAFSKTFSPYSPARWLRERKFKRLLKNEAMENGNALDIGFGRGSLLKKVRKLYRNYNLYGTEYTEEIVNNMSPILSDVELKVVDLEKAKWSKEHDKTYNIVTCQEVIEHLSPNAQIHFFENVNTILKEDSIVIISTPEKDSIKPLKRDNESYKEFAIRFEGQPIANHLNFLELEELATNNGFKIEEHVVVGAYVKSRYLTIFLSMILFLLPEIIEKKIIDLGLFRGRYQLMKFRKE